MKKLLAVGKEKLQSEGILANPKAYGLNRNERTDLAKSRKSTTKAKSIWADTAVISEQGTIESGKLGLSGVWTPQANRAS